MKKNAGIYCSVSTENQAREGYSLPEQQEKLKGLGLFLGIFVITLDRQITILKRFSSILSKILYNKCRLNIEMSDKLKSCKLFIYGNKLPTG